MLIENQVQMHLQQGIGRMPKNLEGDGSLTQNQRKNHLIDDNFQMMSMPNVI